MKPTICCDLDGVLAQYDGWRGIDDIGEPIQGAVEFTKQLAEFAHVVIYTTRTKAFLDNAPSPPGAQDLDRRPLDELFGIVARWLDKHGFYYDDIYTGQGKPFYHVLIDDRAVSCRAQDFKRTLAFEIALAEAQLLCRGPKPSDDVPTLQQTLTKEEHT